MDLKTRNTSAITNVTDKQNKQILSILLTSLLLLVISPMSQAGWEVKWIDKFEGTAVNWDNWTAQTEANYNNEVQCYTDDDSSSEKNYDVSDGTLKIIARKKVNNCKGLNGDQKSWTSGRLNSKDKSEFLYGRIESRIRFYNLEGGTWPAFWMLENRIQEQPYKNDNDFSHWPNSGAGEIDVWEWFSNQPSTYITNFFSEEKYINNNCGVEVRYNYPNGRSDVLNWHNYAIEWTKNNISFYIDETLVSSQDVSNCTQYEEPMFVLLNVAMGGMLGGVIDGDLQEATMEVDYVAHCTDNVESDSEFCNESAYKKNDDLPSITLNIEQNGQLSNTISPANGMVTITVKNANLDTESNYGYSWYSALLPSPIESEHIVSFNPESMSDGNYFVSVTLTDKQDATITTRKYVTVKVSSVNNPIKSTQSDDQTTNSSGASMTNKTLLALALIGLFRSHSRRRKNSLN
jgi:beta-glucanase (GH16 family)